MLITFPGRGRESRGKTEAKTLQVLRYFCSPFVDKSIGSGASFMRKLHFQILGLVSHVVNVEFTFDKERPFSRTIVSVCFETIHQHLLFVQKSSCPCC